jgi:hypothetical protein
MDFFLDWIEKHRSRRTYSTRKTYCNRFGKFRVKGAKIGDLPTRKVRGSDLEAWLEHLEAEGHSAPTWRHAQTSIKHSLELGYQTPVTDALLAGYVPSMDDGRSWSRRLRHAAALSTLYGTSVSILSALAGAARVWPRRAD